MDLGQLATLAIDAHVDDLQPDVTAVRTAVSQALTDAGWDVERVGLPRATAGSDGQADRFGIAMHVKLRTPSRAIDLTLYDDRAQVITADAELTARLQPAADQLSAHLHAHPAMCAAVRNIQADDAAGNLAAMVEDARVIQQRLCRSLARLRALQAHAVGDTQAAGTWAAVSATWDGSPGALEATVTALLSDRAFTPSTHADD